MAKNALIVGVSCDSEPANRAFRDKFGFPYDLLCDVDRSMSRTYGAIDAPDQRNPSRVSYLIDPDGKIAKVYAKVVPGDHPEEVLKDLP